MANKPKNKAAPDKKKDAAARKVGKSTGKGKTAPKAKSGKDPVKQAAGKKGRATQKGRGDGGRQKGTPNKRTVMLREALEAAGMTDDLHPVVQMFKVYTGEMKMKVVVKGGKDEPDEVVEMELPPDLRVKCMAEVAQYLEPKRKAVEVSNQEDEDGEKVPFLLDYASMPGWMKDPRNPNREG